jgi:O-antigen/teichoic acid export membrane protein
VVTIVALPRLVRGGPALRIGLALVAGVGAVLITGVAVAGNLVVTAVGGTRYAALAHLAPYFVLVGALYALTVLLVNAQLAAGAQRPAAGVWASLTVLVVAVATVRPATVAHLLACSVGAAALSVLTTAALKVRRKPFISAR